MVDRPESERPGGPPDEEIGDFAEGQEKEHAAQKPARFSEGQEELPEDAGDKDKVGDFAEGQEHEHDHHTGSFAEGQEKDDKS